MSTLAQALPEELESAWTSLPSPPDYRLLRRPEVGLVMVRARAGGAGRRFNLGEMTVTRCAVTLASGAIGHAYVSGRRPRHAEMAAVLDALLQDPGRRADLEATVIAPLAEAAAARRRAAAARSAPTRVEFFTLVRGED
jgi:alpha-D-ribose 1-methylphosphonate 5-triphosphate synthase subunit PhnG